MLAVTNNAGLFCRALLGTLIALALALNASAQTFPLKDKPITIVVPFSAGGPTDRLAREMAEGLRKPFGGANIVVENILGAGGAIATQKVAKAAPDGHTILIHHIGMATMPSLVRKLGFDVDNDFTYLGMIHEVPMTIVARPSLEAKDYKELTAWVAKNKDKVNLGNAGVGSASHLCGLLWQSSLRTEMVGIPYKGVSMAITDLMAGQIDLLCDQTTNTMAYIETNKIKAFAVTSPKRLSLPSLSNLPTMQELGYQGYEFNTWVGAAVPIGTPQDIILKINQSLRTALASDEIKKIFLDQGAEPVGSTPAFFKTFIQSEIAKSAEIVSKAKISLE